MGAREGDTRGERERLPGRHPKIACLPRARPFSLSPTSSKRLLRRQNGTLKVSLHDRMFLLKSESPDIIFPGSLN